MLGGGMRFWTNCFFSFNIFFLPKKKSKRCERNTKSSNTQGFKLHRPSSKGTKLFSVKIIKAIIIITVLHNSLGRLLKGPLGHAALIRKRPFGTSCCPSVFDRSSSG